MENLKNILYRIVLVAGGVLVIFIFFVGYILHKESETQANNWRANMYVELLVDELNLISSCAGVGEDDEIGLAIIKRLEPQDYKIIVAGRTWKLNLLEKERSGILTVAERDDLYSGSYVKANNPLGALQTHEDEQEKWFAERDRLNARYGGGGFTGKVMRERLDKKIGRNFRNRYCYLGGEHQQGNTISSRGVHIDNCPMLSLKIDNRNEYDPTIVFIDQFSQWEYSWHDIKQYFLHLSKDKQENEMKRLNRLREALDQLRDKAKENIGNMHAKDIPFNQYSRNVAIEIEYQRLSCKLDEARVSASKSPPLLQVEKSN